MSTITNITRNVDGQAGNGIAFGMRTFGGYADQACLAASALPGAFAGSVIGATPWGRHADVATKHNQGTLVWSPPT